jgi:cathepsin B
MNVKDLPDSFDPRDKWPDCSTLNNIRDQSACGTCWAFGAAEAITDRYCTMGVNSNLSVSSADIGFCCGFECGDGCDGGYPSNAWEYWVDYGVVTEDCYPYPFPSCDHHVPNSKNPCPSDEYPTPSCPSRCKNGDNWSQSKKYGDKVYSIDGEDDLMQELYTNGPIEVAFSVYQDFLTYKSGVYQRKSNQFLGGHAVKMMGWGVENGVKYWLIANSWNPNWGDHGYFKIIRGNDECGIEDGGVAGTPKKM